MLNDSVLRFRLFALCSYSFCLRAVVVVVQSSVVNLLQNTSFSKRNRLFP